MSKSFNEKQFNYDYARLMEAQQPSLRIRHDLLNKMRAARVSLPHERGNAQIVDFSRRDKGISRRKTFARLGQVAAVLILVAALVLIYPLIRDGFTGGKSMSSAPTPTAAMAQDMQKNSADSLETAAAPAEAFGTADQTIAEIADSYFEAASPPLEGAAFDATEAQLRSSVTQDLLMEFELSEVRSQAVVEGQEITLIIYNKSEHTYYTSFQIGIQRFNTAGEWQNIKLKDDVIWPAIANEIPPATNGKAGKYREQIYFSTLLDNLAAGQYRIVKEINGENLYAEFTVLD